MWSFACEELVRWDCVSTFNLPLQPLVTDSFSSSSSSSSSSLHNPYHLPYSSFPISQIQA